MKIASMERLSEVSEEAWNALVGDNNPFVEHAFLRLLETSGSVGRGTGWMPSHVLVWDGDTLVGAAPTYIKTDSYGEYIFDWMWAEVAHRLGVDYYPKVVVAVPFTPATGPRLLFHPKADRDAVWNALLVGLQELVDVVEASSLHLLFCTDEEAAFLEEAGLSRRRTHQFHWRNNGYRSFDDFLGAMRSSARKQIRRERRKVEEAGVAMEFLTGDEASSEIWRTMYRLYIDTGARKWGTPYLTRAFFENAAATVGARALLGIARWEGEVVAGTLSFQKGKHLYGRYWGAVEAIDGLHFELCYYQLIEYAIARGLTLVEAGAQGAHKVKRGFLPAITHSAHWMKHPILRAAFDDYTHQEGEALQEQIEDAQAMGPFRADAIPAVAPVAGQER